MINETIKSIHELNERKKQLELELKGIETELEPLRQTALTEMTDLNIKEYHNDGLVIFLGAKTTKGYSREDEIEILNILKNQNLTNCINIKESLSKKDLNKELKTNTTLQDLIKNYGQEKTTEFVSVMTEEAAEIRQQAIDAAKSK